MTDNTAMANLPPTVRALLDELLEQDPGRSVQLRAVACACAQILEAGGHITTARVAAIAARQGAPSARTMYNGAGRSYQRLIDACKQWASPSGRQSTKPDTARATSIADRMPQSPLRGEVRALESEYRLLRLSFAALKCSATPTDVATVTACATTDFSHMERRALEACLSPVVLQRMGWRVEADGSVVGDGGARIFPPSFAGAVEKALRAAP